MATVQPAAFTGAFAYEHTDIRPGVAIDECRRRARAPEPDRQGSERTARLELHGDEADLFAEHHDALLRSTRRAANAPEALIEDACQFAWTQLIRTQPDRGPRLFGWLRTVAIHEAYRLSRAQRRDTALEELAAPEVNGGSCPEGWEALIEGPVDLDSQLDAKRALSVLASLPERQRRYLALLVAGYRYQEIVELAGVSYTNVNKHLTRARASVRRAEQTA